MLVNSNQSNVRIWKTPLHKCRSSWKRVVDTGDLTFPTGEIPLTSSEYTVSAKGAILLIAGPSSRYEGTSYEPDFTSEMPGEYWYESAVNRLLCWQMTASEMLGGWEELRPSQECMISSFENDDKLFLKKALVLLMQVNGLTFVWIEAWFLSWVLWGDNANA